MLFNQRLLSALFFPALHNSLHSSYGKICVALQWRELIHLKSNVGGKKGVFLATFCFLNPIYQIARLGKCTGKARQKMVRRKGGETTDMETCLKFYSCGNPVWLPSVGTVFCSFVCLYVQMFFEACKHIPCLMILSGVKRDKNLGGWFVL